MNNRYALTLAAAAAGVASAAVTTTGHWGRRVSFIARKDGTTLFYKDWGAGRPLLFVHGSGINSEVWDSQMLPLATEGFRCVAFDRRGHGRSGDIPNAASFDSLADDVAAVMAVLELKDVTLVGHSKASAEIARYFTRHGAGRVSRVVLLAPPLPISTEPTFAPEMTRIAVPVLVIHETESLATRVSARIERVNSELRRFAHGLAKPLLAGEVGGA